MDHKEINWYQSKIKGSLAEVICRTHFEAMGYFVESYGIENRAPIFSSLRYKKNAGRGAYWNKFPDSFTKQPDFLISRIDSSNKRDAILVEVKYRTSIDEDKLEKELSNGYKELNGYPVLYYLVIREPYPHVMILFNMDKYKKWYHAYDKSLLRFPIYDKKDEGFLDIVSSYKDIVRPAIIEILGKNDRNVALHDEKCGGKIICNDHASSNDMDDRFEGKCDICGEFGNDMIKMKDLSYYIDNVISSEYRDAEYIRSTAIEDVMNDDGDMDYVENECFELEVGAESWESVVNKIIPLDVPEGDKILELLIEACVGTDIERRKEHTAYEDEKEKLLSSKYVRIAV